MSQTSPYIHRSDGTVQRGLSPRTSLDLLNEITIATPCAARWDEMTGTNHVRFCSRCRKNVYDISGLGADEAFALLTRDGEMPCVRLFRRADGTVLTADCPVGIRSIGRRLFGWALVGVAAVIGWLACWSALRQNQRHGLVTMGEPAPLLNPQKNGGVNP